MSYESRAFCKCGWNTYAPFDDIFHVHYTSCPDCGERKPDRLYANSNWKVKIVKWVSTAVWWNPFTWSNGYYEESK